MQDIVTIIEQHSPYARAYKYMHNIEEEEAERERAIQEKRAPHQVILHFKRGPDRRRYNETTCNVTVLWLKAGYQGVLQCNPQCWEALSTVDAYLETEGC